MTDVSKVGNGELPVTVWRLPLLIIAGFSLFISWPYDFFYSSALSQYGRLATSGTNGIWNASTIALTLSLLVLSVLAALPACRLKLARLSSDGRLILTSAIISCFGTSATILAIHSIIPAWWSYFGSAIAGVSNAFIYMAWGKVLVRSDHLGTDITIGASFLLAMLIAFAVANIGAVASGIIVALIPLCTGLCCIAASKMEGPASRKTSPDDNRAPISNRSLIPFGVLVIVAAFWLVYSFAEHKVGFVAPALSTLPSVAAFVAGTIAATIIVATCIWYAHRMSIVLGLGIAIPLLAVGLFALSTAPQLAYISYAAAFAAMVIMNICVWTDAVSSGRTDPTRALWYVAATRSALQIGGLIGLLAMPELEVLGTGTSTLAVVTALLVTTAISLPFVCRIPEEMQILHITTDAKTLKDTSVGAGDKDHRAGRIMASEPLDQDTAAIDGHGSLASIPSS